MTLTEVRIGSWTVWLTQTCLPSIKRSAEAIKMNSFRWKESSFRSSNETNHNVQLGLNRNLKLTPSVKNQLQSFENEKKRSSLKDCSFLFKRSSHKKRIKRDERKRHLPELSVQSRQMLQKGLLNSVRLVQHFRLDFLHEENFYAFCGLQLDSERGTHCIKIGSKIETRDTTT